MYLIKLYIGAVFLHRPAGGDVKAHALEGGSVGVNLLLTLVGCG